MGLFDTPQEKWIKQKSNKPWNLMFTFFCQYDAMVTKLMVYKCVDFADKLINSPLISTDFIYLRAEAIALAKMQFYHAVTKSQTVHNLFYGYIYELYVNHHKSDIETANLCVKTIQQREQYYLSEYYGCYSKSVGDFVPVIKSFCRSASNLKSSDGTLAVNVSRDDLHHYAAKLLMDMHISFLQEVQ